jgi:DNA segregation ATPase FtsK/SpoIIIE, S-DNA-T family
VNMANRAKSSKKSQPADKTKLKPEKEERVTVRDLAKDERTHKILGVTSLLCGLFLLIAFASYLFTWKVDQDKVFRGAAILWPSEGIKTANLMGNLGAYIAHQFFYNGFGLASFIFCTLFFVVGANALFAKKIFSVGRNIRYLLVGIIYFSVALAFISSGSFFPWGGEFGKLISNWLSVTLGTVGTAALLLVVGIAYVIWRFNPVFNVPQLPRKKLAGENDVLLDPAKATLIVDDELTLKDTPKGKGKKLVTPVVETPPLHDLRLTQKKNLKDELASPARPFNAGVSDDTDPEEVEDDSELPVEMIPEPVMIKAVDRLPKRPIADIPLQINAVPAIQDEEEVPTEKLLENVAPYEPTLDLRDYKYPGLDLLEVHGSEKIVQDPAELEANKNQIINTLKNYDIAIQKISATVGPTVTLYEIVPAAGVRISRIKNLEDDIALSLAALGIRIIAPIPGKGTIGIEVPNVRKTVVSMKSLLASEKFQVNNFSLPIAIGKKIDNENFIVDLTTMPHLLMAGATGQGKSVGLNAILVSLLYKKHPSQLKFVLVDPKKVELSIYRTIEKHFLAKLPGEEDAIITDTKKVVHTLNALCIEMDTRYDLLKEAGARNIKEYNEKFIKRKLNPEKGHQFLPFIVLVVDEFADLIMTAGKEVEMPIARLAQLARAIGIHLIIATQRPSVNIITGTIKANFPARIAFKVSSKVDSRTILDTGGAEQLIGKGDMLISYNGELTRLQCAFVDTPEVEAVCGYIGDQRGYAQAFLLPEYVDEKELEGKDFDIGSRDALFEDAARLIVQSQIGSTSLLQRRMKLGYNRAGRLMDQLEASGVVGPSQGSKAREVLIKTEADLERHLVDQLG